MGYSVYVIFKDEDSKNKMLAFMEDNYQELDKMLGFELIKETAVRLSDDLSYVNDIHKYIVGFDYVSWIDPFERNYINAICRWMALNSGCERPYTVYDGCENEYITNIDENGYREFKPHYKYVDKNDIFKYNNLLKEELDKFSKKWKVFKKVEVVNFIFFN